MALMIEYIADLLLASGAVGACIYCAVLSKKLTRFTDLERGMGGAIAVLSVQVDDMTKALSKAQVTAKGSSADLNAVISRAEEAAGHLEILLASMHDLPEASEQSKSTQTPELLATPPASSATWRSEAHLRAEVESEMVEEPGLPQWRRSTRAGGAQ